MAIIDNSFVMVDEQYYAGAALDEWNGKIKLVEARQNQEGEVYKEWGYPQRGGKTPTDKAIPWGVGLGDRKKTIEVLEALLVTLRGF